MGDFSAGKVQSDVELITGAPALVVAKLETKAPELFAQLAATGGATDEEKDAAVLDKDGKMPKTAYKDLSLVD